MSMHYLGGEKDFCFISPGITARSKKRTLRSFSFSLPFKLFCCRIAGTALTNLRDFCLADLRGETREQCRPKVTQLRGSARIEYLDSILQENPRFLVFRGSIPCKTWGHHSLSHM